MENVFLFAYCIEFYTIRKKKGRYLKNSFACTLVVLSLNLRFLWPTRGS